MNRKRTGEYQSKQPHNKRRKGAQPRDEVPLDPQQQEQGVKAYLHHAVKVLAKGIKKSKTFEVQKLTRKLKQAREPKEGAVDPALVANLEGQLAAIKTLALDSLPSHLLSTRLPKLPSLRTVSFLPSLLSSIPKPSKPFPALEPVSAEGKARNRLLASKVVGEAWDEVARAVRKRMGEEVEGKGKKVEEVKKKGITMDSGRAAALEKALLEGGEEEEDEGESSDDEGPAAGFSEDEGGADEEEDDDEAIQREEAALEEGDGSASEWSDSEDGEAASSSDDDDAGAASDSSFPPAKPSKPTKKRQPSLSPSPPPAKKSKSASAAPGKPITSSSFLPSLAAGYISYSDSDGEDAKWVKDAEREDKKGARKNRRGQRARQAIWEKKFGSAANHVVKAAGGKPVPLAQIKEQKAKRAAAAASSSSGKATRQPTQGADEPYDPRHGRGGSTNPNAQSLGKSRAFGGPYTVPAPAAPAPAVAAEGGEKMHPSWEAKRRQKEALKQSAAAPVQGKKIVFD
ncbi:hypothetical protein JCM10207_006325 [Rhodosporidiobolus poonsookiae]